METKPRLGNCRRCLSLFGNYLYYTSERIFLLAVLSFRYAPSRLSRRARGDDLWAGLDNNRVSDLGRSISDVRHARHAGLDGIQTKDLPAVRNRQDLPAGSRGAYNPASRQLAGGDRL